MLDAAAQASDWDKPPPPDTFRGIAYNCYIGRGGRFKTYVAQVVELRRVGDRLAVKRVFCAVDPGLAVNPNTFKAQIEGGIGFAMTTALKSKITFSNGGTDQSNFFDYPLLSIDEMPEIVPIVLASDRPPQGVGEVVLAPVAPAIAQACCMPPAGGSTSCRSPTMPSRRPEANHTSADKPVAPDGENRDARTEGHLHVGDILRSMASRPNSTGRMTSRCCGSYANNWV